MHNCNIYIGMLFDLHNKRLNLFKTIRYGTLISSKKNLNYCSVIIK